jgi:hypothetical protein
MVIGVLQMTDLEDVQSFREKNPLWTGESKFKPGTIHFYEEHRAAYIEDCFAGEFDLRFLPLPRPNGQDMQVVDPGCGIGFWVTEFAIKQFTEMLRKHFLIEEIHRRFFPARSLPFTFPERLHKWLDKRLGFMVYATLKKPCADS